MTQRRFAGFDGLRGIAAMVVVVDHLGPMRMPDGQWWTAPLVWIANYGWMGVDLFFVLSGFLITGILIENRDSPSYFRTFYANRARRIFPLYFALLLACTIVLPVIVPALRWMSVRADGVWVYWAFFSNQLVLFDLGLIYCAWIPVLSPCWSLAVEEQFYIAWSAAARLLSTRNLAVVAIAAIVLGIVLRCAMLTSSVWSMPVYVPRILYFTPTHLDGLAVGILARLALASGYLPALDRFARMWPLWLAATVAVFAMDAALAPDLFNSYRPIMMRFGFTITAFLFGAIAMRAALTDGWLRRVLELRPMKRLGNYSYCIYLYHLPITAVLLAAWPGLDGALGVTSALGLKAAAVILFAALSYRYIEQPILKNKTGFARPEEPARLNKLLSEDHASPGLR